VYGSIATSCAQPVGSKGCHGASPPQGGAKTAAVRHEVPDLHLRDVAERVVDGPEFGDELDHRIIERQQPAIAQLHDGDARERLRDGRPVIDGLRVDRPLRLDVLVSLARVRHHAAVVDDHQAAADDARFSKVLTVEREHVGPAVHGI
jgi:hypothetical protein